MRPQTPPVLTPAAGRGSAAPQCGRPPNTLHFIVVSGPPATPRMRPLWRRGPAAPSGLEQGSSWSEW